MPHLSLSSPAIVPMAFWKVLTASSSSLHYIVEQGMMSAEVTKGCQISSRAFVVPSPPIGMVISFTSFHACGFGVSTLFFLHRLLHFYDIRLPDLTPNGILHLAMFVTLCECYLGIEPPLGAMEEAIHGHLQQLGG